MDVSAATSFSDYAGAKFEMLFRKSLLLRNARIETQKIHSLNVRIGPLYFQAHQACSYKKEAGPSSGSELCDMDYTVIETKRQVSDAGNLL